MVNGRGPRDWAEKSKLKSREHFGVLALRSHLQCRWLAHLPQFLTHPTHLGLLGRTCPHQGGDNAAWAGINFDIGDDEVSDPHCFCALELWLEFVCFFFALATWEDGALFHTHTEDLLLIISLLS